MTARQLTWLFAALFVTTGLPLAIVSDPFWRRLCGSLSLLGLGGFALALAGDGLARGTVRFQFSVFQRHQQPLAFWAAIALVMAAGTAVLIAAAWAAFFKEW